LEIADFEFRISDSFFVPLSLLLFVCFFFISPAKFFNLLSKHYFMSKEVKSRIHLLIDSIKDENILQMVMEDVAYYADSKDIINELSKEQLKELNEAITEADSRNTIDWIDFKKEIDEWKKDSCHQTFKKIH